MTRMVHCIKLGKEAEGLGFQVYPGGEPVPGTGLPMVIISSKLTVQRIDNEIDTV